MLNEKLGGIPVFLVIHNILLIPVWRYWFWHYTGISLPGYTIKYTSIRSYQQFIFLFKLPEMKQTYYLSCKIAYS